MRLADKQGLSLDSVSGILKNLAPLLMGLFGRQAADSRSNLTGSGEGGFLESIFGGGGLPNFLQSFLDKDGDGDIMDDTLGRFFK